ncbi:galanin receptor type 2 [Pontoporia blainvillei]|uniref:Galanin receptor type 2 n=1 Tax=Pontoporia blainvillei TaxID=48723 RepID=A0ABX0S6D1_PONBL|nr:galanin receptor type 2 [Pontoporia blainvillei]
MNGSGGLDTGDANEAGGRGSWQLEAVIVPMLFALIFLVGTIGNSLVLAVVLRGGQAVSTTNLLILNLGVADLCFIVCCVPFQATIYTLDDWVFGSLLCKAVHFLIFLTMHASSFTLAAVSLDRYLAIRYPLHSRELRTPRNALAAIGLIWGLSLLFSGPYLSYYRQSRLANLPVCHPAWSAPCRRATDLCTFVFSYLLPVLVLSLTYARTLRYLWRDVDPVAAGSGARRAKRKLTRMIIIVAALFCLCWMPHHALILCVWFGRFPLTRATYALRILSHLVSYSNSLRQSYPQPQEVQETIQIPNGSASLLMDVQVFVSNVFSVDILWYTVSSTMLLRLGQSPQARVDRDGHIELYLALTTETNCDFGLFHFPRDQSDCSLSFFASGNTGADRTGAGR